MTSSDAQRAAGYELPESLTGHELVCVSFMMLDTHEYRAAVNAQLHALGKWWSWKKSFLPGDTRASQAALIFRTLLHETLSYSDECFPETSGCTDYAPSAYIIEYNPNDPFRTPDLVPDGYAFPPWYQATNTTSITLGTSLGDVVTDITRTSAAPIIPPASGYPRFRIHLNGAGTCEIHLVKINGGGYAQITVDDDVFTAEFLSLAKDTISIPPETSDDIIIERIIETPGTHHIDVLFIPLVNDELPFIGQGGALRKIVLCGFDEMARNVELQTIEVGDCFQIQWKYTDESGDDWRDLGTPVCNGADGEDGADGRTPEFQIVPAGEGCQTIQWRYTGDVAWIDLATVCDGEDGADGAPGADGTDGAPGEQGIPGEDGADGVCPECDEGEVTDPETGGNNCAGAVGLVETLLSILNYNLDQIDYFVDVTYGLINVVTLNLLETLGSLPLIGTVQNALIFAKDLGTGSIRSGVNSPDFKDDVICRLYCAVEAEGAFNETSFGVWIGELSTEYPYPHGGSAFVDLADNVIEFSKISRRYAIEALNTDARCESLCVCDDDRLISWEVLTSEAPEGLTHQVMVKLTSPVGDTLPSDVTVNIIATPGTASEADYTLLSTFVVIPAGSINGDTIPVSVAITTSDGADNGETFTLTIESVEGPAVIDEDNDVHTVTIEDTGCAPGYNTWTVIGATPTGWAAIGAMSTAGMTGLDPVGLSTSEAPADPYGGSRGSNQNWTTTNRRAGIQHDLAEPCEVTTLAFRTSVANSNTKRGGIIVKIAATQEWEVLFNTARASAGNTQDWSWTGAAREIDAVRYCYADGGLAGQVRSIQVSNINIAI